MANDKLAVVQAEETVREIDQIILIVKELVGQTRALTKEFTILNKGLSSGRPKEYNASLKQLEKTEEKQIKLQEKKRLAEIKLQKAREKSIDQFNKQEAKIKEQNRSYKLLEAQLLKTTKRYQDLAVSKGINSKEAQEELANLKRLRSEYVKVNQSVTNTTRSNKALGVSLKSVGSNVLSGLGIIGIVDTIIRVGTSAVSTIVDFEDAVNKLGAISGATAEELKLLEDQALSLGSTTAFTATEVSGLQLELAKLGFNTNEIQLATKDIIDLSIALDTDASRAAALAGSQLRAFNLEASETKRVASVLGIATTKSALDVEKLESALRTVSPVASTFNFSIEETVSLLGTLANAGFRGEQAGTALRNILLNLADVNGTLAQELGSNVDSFEELIPALIKLRDSGIDLNETLELTDKRSVAAFNRFLDGAETSKKLKDELQGLDSELSDLAEKRLDTVAGKMKLLTSAWEGFILSMNDGNSVISESLKLLLDGITHSLEASKQFKEEILSMSGLLKNLGIAIINVNGFLYDLTDGFIGVKKEVTGVQKDILDTITMFNNLVASPKMLKLGVEPIFDFGSTIGDQGEYSDKRGSKSSSKTGYSAKSSPDQRADILKEDTAVLLDLKKAQEGVNNELEQFIKLREIENQRANRDITNGLEKTLEDATVPMIDQEADNEKARLEKLMGYRDIVADGLANLGLEDTANDFVSFFDSILDAEAEFGEKFVKGLQLVGSFASEVIESITANRIESLERENESFQDSTDAKIRNLERQLQYENLSSEERQALLSEIETFEAQKLEKERQTERQQFKAQQQADSQQALINGALSATKTLAHYGFTPAGIAAAAASIAFAEVQSALILSKEVPEYYKGTNNAEGGLAWTQERGAEMITDKKGNVKTLGNKKGAQLTMLEKGDKVFTAGKTKNILDSLNPLNDTDMLNTMVLDGMKLPDINIDNSNKGITREEMSSVIDKALKKYTQPMMYDDGQTRYIKQAGKHPKAIGEVQKSNVVVIGGGKIRKS